MLATVPMLGVIAFGSSTAHAGMYGSQELRWPQGVVYYKFDESLPQPSRDAVRKAVDHYNAHKTRSGVTIFPTTFAPNPRDFVKIYPTDGASRVSHIGYAGGEQKMWINSRLPIWQVVVHEFGHVIGLYHEHQRCEREIWLTAPDPPGDNMERICDLPATERYNPLSVMHYSDGELALHGAKLREHSAPAKSLHPGLVESDVRTIATMYRASGKPFSIVSVMHGMCLTAPNHLNPVQTQMKTCDVTDAGQAWVYNAGSGELRTGPPDNAVCLDAALVKNGEPAQVQGCNGSPAQAWDFANNGVLVLRTLKDAGGRPLCVEIPHWDRRDGAPVTVDYCHRGDNQQWRRHPARWRVGLTTAAFVSDVIPPGVNVGPQDSKCMHAPNDLAGTQLRLMACEDQFHEPQRFTRTLNGQLLVFKDRAAAKCVDAALPEAGARIELQQCADAPGQRWVLSPSGTLYNVDSGLCIRAAGADDGSVLRLATCEVGDLAIRWSTREPS